MVWTSKLGSTDVFIIMQDFDIHIIPYTLIPISIPGASTRDTFCRDLFLYSLERTLQAKKMLGADFKQTYNLSAYFDQ